MPFSERKVRNYEIQFLLPTWSLTNIILQYVQQTLIVRIFICPYTYIHTIIPIPFQRKEGPVTMKSGIMLVKGARTYDVIMHA